MNHCNQCVYWQTTAGTCPCSCHNRGLANLVTEVHLCREDRDQLNRIEMQLNQLRDEFHKIK